MNIFPSVVSGLTFVENNLLSEVVLKEVLGLNLPKSLTVRNRDEMLDVASDQFGGTAGYVASGFATEKLLNRFYKGVAKTLKNPAAKNVLKWRELGQSFAIFSMNSAIYWAIPFVRDYLTLRRTGSETFTQLIGAEQRTDAQTPEGRQRMKEGLAYYKKRTIQVLGIGLLTAAASVGGSVLAMKRGASLGKMFGLLHQKLALKDGAFKNYHDWPTFFFVFGTSYAGRLHAVRDKYEIKEQLLHFANSITWFFLPKILFDKLALKRYEHELGKETLGKLLKRGTPDATHKVFLNRIQTVLAHAPEKMKAAQKIYVRQTAFGLASAIGLSAVMPALLNIYLTKQRLQLAQEESANIHVPMKTMDEFLQDMKVHQQLSSQTFNGQTLNAQARSNENMAVGAYPETYPEIYSEKGLTLQG